MNREEESNKSPGLEAMRIWKEISLWKREFIGSTPKVRGGGVGGASGLVLYAVVFVLNHRGRTRARTTTITTGNARTTY